MKDLEYYMNLNYTVEVRQLSEEEGGGYIAQIPQLGKYAFVGDGETVEEAMESLNEIKRHFFEEYLRDGIPIPLPKPLDDDIEQYSGKFLLRIPSILHKKLAEEAERNKTTLNQYCNYLLSSKLELDHISKEIAKIQKPEEVELEQNFSHSTRPTRQPHLNIRNFSN